MYVVKRDGRRENFDHTKILKAIKKAFIPAGTANVDYWAKIITDMVVSQLNAD
ncbi:MAG: ATP cone domain-containing protein, partial [Eubacteriales bacterium]